MDIKQQTNNVASQGRYGDTMLMHVNPAEVQGLASIMPLTQNPQTGQPEAFLPFLAPLLGSMAGTALFTGLSAPVAGAIGSGIATAIQSGDLKQGIMSGITGFGLGKALGAAGFGEAGRAAKEAGEIASQVNIPEAIPTAIEKGVTEFNPAGIDLSGVGTTAAENIASSIPESLLTSSTTPMLGDVPLDIAGEAAKAAQFPSTAATGGFDAFASQLAKPSSYLPIAMGEGQRGVMQSQEQFEKEMAQMELDRKKAREKMYADNPENIPMSSRYYGASGGIMSLAEGGPIGGVRIMDEVSKIPPRQLPPRQPREIIPDNSFESAMAGLQDYKYKPRESKEPVRQAYEKMQVNELTGVEMPTGQFVPASDYRAGIDPEFNYFPRSNKPATYLGDYLGGIGGIGGGVGQIGIGGKGGIYDYGGGNSQRIEPSYQNIFSGDYFNNLTQNNEALNSMNLLTKNDFLNEYKKDNPEPRKGGKAAGARRRQAYDEKANEAFDDYVMSNINPIISPVGLPQNNFLPKESITSPMITGLENRDTMNDFMSIEEINQPITPLLEDRGFGPGIRRS